ncbi:RHS repeat domain-containing protein [Algoriphagus aquatilis]|uniref:RHS repeat domain-containing protein n=2 Tax=Bacteroidota TaxID=976 RepID=A0ABW0BZB4_9BACT
MTLSVHGKFLDKKKARVNEASFAAMGGKTALLDQLNELALNSQMAGGPNPIAVLNLVDIVAKDLQKKETPEAYLIYALYDEDSNRYEVGKKVLTRNAANQHEELEEKLAIKKNGYIETFVVNETSQDVWFDNFKILSQGSILVQETHYDPWGLELTGIGYEYAGVKKNNWKFQSQESIDDLGLNWSSFKWRNHQPDIGRFFNIDPLADKYVHNSPYAFSENKVVAHVELEGLESVSIQTEGRGIVPVAGNLSFTASGSYGIAIGTRKDQKGIHAVQYINGSMGPASGAGIAGGVGTYLNSGNLEDLSGLSFGIGGFLGGAPTGLPDGSFEFNTSADGSQLGGMIPFVSPGKALGGGVWAEASYTQFLGEPVSVSNMSEGDLGNFAEKLGVSIEQFSKILNDVTKYVNSQNNRNTSTDSLKSDLKENSLTKTDATRVEINRRIKKD